MKKKLKTKYLAGGPPQNSYFGAGQIGLSPANMDTVSRSVAGSVSALNQSQEQAQADSFKNIAKSAMSMMKKKGGAKFKYQTAGACPAGYAYDTATGQCLPDSNWVGSTPGSGVMAEQYLPGLNAAAGGNYQQTDMLNPNGPNVAGSGVLSSAFQTDPNAVNAASNTMYNTLGPTQNIVGNIGGQSTTAGKVTDLVEQGSPMANQPIKGSGMFKAAPVAGLVASGVAAMATNMTSDKNAATYGKREKAGTYLSNIAEGAAKGSQFGPAGMGAFALVGAFNAKKAAREAENTALGIREDERALGVANREAFKNVWQGQQTGFGYNNSANMNMQGTSAYYGAKTGGVRDEIKRVPGGLIVPIKGTDAVEYIGNKHSESKIDGVSGIRIDENTEVEHEETKQPVQMAKAGGADSSKGKMRDYFFSAYLKLGGKSFAQRHKEILASGGKKSKVQALVQKLAQKQEAVANQNGEKDRSPATIANPKSNMYGGIHKYQTAGEDLMVGPEVEIDAQPQGTWDATASTTAASTEKATPELSRRERRRALRENVPAGEVTYEGGKKYLVPGIQRSGMDLGVSSEEDPSYLIDYSRYKRKKDRRGEDESPFGESNRHITTERQALEEGFNPYLEGTRDYKKFENKLASKADYEKNVSGAKPKGGTSFEEAQKLMDAVEAGAIKEGTYNSDEQAAQNKAAEAASGTAAYNDLSGTKPAVTTEDPATAQSNTDASNVTVRDQNQANAAATSAQNSVAPGGTSNNAGQASADAAAAATNNTNGTAATSTSSTGTPATTTTTATTSSKTGVTTTGAPVDGARGKLLEETQPIAAWEKPSKTKGKLGHTPRENIKSGIWSGDNYDKEWIPLVKETMADPELSQKIYDYLISYQGPADEVEAVKKRITSDPVSSIAAITEEGTDGDVGPFHNAILNAMKAIQPKPQPVPVTTEEKPEEKPKEQPKVEPCPEGYFRNEAGECLPIPKGFKPQSYWSKVAGLTQYIAPVWSLLNPYQKVRGITGAPTVKAGTMPRVQYNLDRQMEKEENIAATNMVRNQSGIQAGVLQAFNNKQNANILKISNAEATANKQYAAAEMGMQLDASKTNAGYEMQRQMFNKKLEQEENVYAREGRLKDLQQLGLVTAGNYKDMKMYEATERLAEAMQISGEYTRRKMYEALKNDPAFKNMPDVKIKEFANAYYNLTERPYENTNANESTRNTQKLGGTRKYTSRLGELTKRKSLNFSK